MRGYKLFIDYVNLLLGIWLIISPWVLGTTANVAGTAALVVMGIVILLFSLWAVSQSESRTPEWWNFALGIVLFILPWLFRYTAARGDAWNSWIVGFVVAILALIAMPLIKGMHGHGHEHQHQT
jgi:hypothetical protein